ncbi:hypothetical protein BJY00DRAFT_232592 [Aspergillus carlsbadensis]|nr:hypothetical protein BJY00DRAFT_232592 [Aspergillus carlsbadensis]
MTPNADGEHEMSRGKQTGKQLAYKRKSTCHILSMIKVGESQFTAIYSFANYTNLRPPPDGRRGIVEYRPKNEVMQAAAQAPHASVVIISVRVPSLGSRSSWCRVRSKHV